MGYWLALRNGELHRLKMQQALVGFTSGNNDNHKKTRH
jgi:hypothetical protein